jgi:hypothetical protein
MGHPSVCKNQKRGPVNRKKADILYYRNIKVSSPPTLLQRENLSALCFLPGCDKVKA